MDKALAATLLILFALTIMTPIILWINNRFNENPDEIGDLSAENLDKLKIKKQLLNLLERWIQESGLTHEQIALKLDVTMYAVSDIVHQRLDKFTVDSLIDLVLKTGKSVKLVVNNKHQ